MFTNPIGIIIGLVGVLAAGVVYLAKNWNAFLISVAKSSKAAAANKALGAPLIAA